MVNMMTNAVYIGHWMHKDRIVQWDNHPAIVSEELFYRAFNYLSPYTLTGEPNLQYTPPFRRERSKEDRGEAKPIYKRINWHLLRRCMATGSRLLESGHEGIRLL